MNEPTNLVKMNSFIQQNNNAPYGHKKSKIRITVFYNQKVKVLELTIQSTNNKKVWLSKK